MSIATNYGHVSNALQFYTNKDLYVEFAKSTPWSDESNPDSESASTVDLESSIAFLKADQVLLVYDGGVAGTTANGTDIVYNNHKWIVSTEDNAYNNNAHYVLLTAKMSGTSLPAFTYRQIGIRKGTVFANNVTGNTTLSANVLDKGKLWFYENKTPRNHTTDSVINIKYLINC